MTNDNSYERWTAEEEKTVVHLVRENPDNIQHAFYLASKQLGRTTYAIAGRWYASIRRVYSAFELSGSETFTNQKNISRKIEIEAPQSTEIKDVRQEVTSNAQEVVIRIVVELPS